MIPYTVFILPLFILASSAKLDARAVPVCQPFIFTDTMPDICTYLPGTDIEAVRPFTSPLSKSFTDPNNFETYNGCQYQFFTDHDKPQLAVRMIKWTSKQEALEDYKMQVQRHFESWGITPERLSIEADSAYFSIETNEPNKCDECGLVVIQGLYTIYISFKGEYEKTTREGKKQASLKILKMMYDRIPGLAPSRIRNRQ